MIRTHRPAAHFAEAEALGSGLVDLRLHGAAEARALQGTASQRGMADAQTLEARGMGLFEEAQAGDYIAISIDGEHVPAVLIDVELVAPVGCQLAPAYG